MHVPPLLRIARLRLLGALFATVLVCAPRADAFVYWGNGDTGTPNTGSIGRANGDGSGASQSFIGGADNPNVAVDGAHVYWTDLSANSIGRANLDGSGVIQNFIGGANRPNGVAVDRSHILWGNANGGLPGGMSTIGRANLDGTGANQSFIQLSGQAFEGGLAVDGTHIYWAGTKNDGSQVTTIGRANLDGAGVSESFISVGSVGKGNLACGVAVDRAHVYWTDYFAGTIGRANLDGTGVTPSFIAGAHNPCGIADDGAKLYWANTSSDSIGSANLDGSGVSQSFIATASRPTGVAADTTIKGGLIVNSTGDLNDATPGDGVCDTGQTTTSGQPECTLRAAIEEANAEGGGTITFNLPAGSGPIMVLGGLPPITTPVTVDGTGTNPVIQGNGRTGAVGLALQAAGDHLTNLTVRGFYDEIAITGPGGDQLDHLEVGPGSATNDLNGCQSTSGNPAVAIMVGAPGNQIGPAVDVADMGGCDLVVQGLGATGNTIGGVALGVTSLNGDPTRRYASGRMVIQANANTLTGALGPSGIGADPNLREPNLIGDLVITGNDNQVLSTQALDVGVTGDHNALGNAASGGDIFGSVVSPAAGICPQANSGNSTVAIIDGANNTVTGDEVHAGCAAGVFLEGGGENHLLRNVISANGSPREPATGGVVINGSSDNTIESNTIRRNLSSGVVVLDGSFGDTITNNQIYGNAGLGIDLNGDGVSPVEGSPFLANPGPNQMLNYPQFVRVTWGVDRVRLIGQLLNVGGESYHIEVFANSQCNRSGFGEGESLLGASTVNTFGTGRLTGEAAFDVTVPAHHAPGRLITATATDPQGDTSEFSACTATGRLGAATVGMATGAAHAAQGEGIAGILRNGGVSVTGAGGGAGTYSIQATAQATSARTSAVAARAHTVLVLAGTVRVHHAGVFKLKLRLTVDGKRLLRHAKRITLTFTATQAPPRHHRGNRTKARQRIAIGRRGIRHR